MIDIKDKHNISRTKSGFSSQKTTPNKIITKQSSVSKFDFADAELLEIEGSQASSKQDFEEGNRSSGKNKVKYQIFGTEQSEVNFVDTSCTDIEITGTYEDKIRYSNKSQLQSPRSFKLPLIKTIPASN